MEKVIDLISKSTASRRADIKKFQKERKLLTSHNGFKKGDIIEFWAGYNGDIRYRAEIVGFDKDGDIYLDWDAYWFPIKDDNKRKIKQSTEKKAGLNKPSKKAIKPTPAQIAARKKFAEMAKSRSNKPKSGVSRKRR